MPTVSVIILNWNGKSHLQQCLPALFSQSYTDFEIILVDNGSIDGSKEWVAKEFPQIYIIPHAGNEGFARGNNRGFANARGRYLVILNNDTICSPSFLKKMVQAAEKNEKIGMVAAKVYSGLEGQIIDSIGIRICQNGMGYLIGHHEIDEGQYDTLEKCFAPCGVAALYKREMLDEIGYFDPHFFAYYEDLDLGWRARLMGWECGVATKTVVHHVHSATSRTKSGFKTFYLHRNKLWFILKNYPLSFLWRYGWQIIIYDLLALFHSLFFELTMAGIFARFSTLKGINHILKKRRKIQKIRKIPFDTIKNWLEPSENPLKTWLRKYHKK